MTRIAAVLFDVGGVVTDSPLHAIARYERERGIAPGAVNRAVVAAGEAGAWSRLERGELTLATFREPFEADCRAAGLDVDAAALMAAIADAATPRPRMLGAIRRLREHGLRVGVLTNNWRRDGAPSADGGLWAPPKPPDARSAPAEPWHSSTTRTPSLRDHFDVFVESCVVGMRKPDARIYALACRELGVPPPATAFLDDIGRNLKAARELGMTTIKVETAEQALRELGAVAGLDLLG
ncbi:MAG: HAD family phosphatase [Candidatus Rokubacteria bacterium]|nr:HAD family phosphatase [Candidatus Rokubacteria bacterium]